MKSRMISAILWMSILIFIFSFSTLFYPHYYPQKDMNFLSDYYSEFYFEEERANLEQLIHIMNENDMEAFFVKYAYSNAKGCMFSEAFFKKLDISGQINLFSYNDKVALVNSKNKNWCIEENGRFYIESGPDLFEVIGFYHDDRDDSLYETPYYINIASDEIKGRKDYDTVIIDYHTEENLNQINMKLADVLNAVSVSNWSGAMNNIVDTRPVYVLVIGLCGLVICLNCIGFLSVWINSFSYEFEVRKMVGATEKSNHTLLIKRLFSIFLIADVGAIVTGAILFVFIKNITAINNIRMLFGTELHLIPVLCASISALLLIIITAEIILKIRKVKGIA